MLVQGPALLSLKNEAYRLLLEQGFHEDEIPQPLRPKKKATTYDDQVKAAVKSLTSLIEPIMIAVMGFLVGTIVLAVFLPIFELQKQLAK